MVVSTFSLVSIRRVVWPYAVRAACSGIRFPLSLRTVEDPLFERGIDIRHETVRRWRNRFRPLFAGDIRRQRLTEARLAIAPRLPLTGS